MPALRSVDIAIVGAGASGVMVAAQLVTQSRGAGILLPSVLLIDNAAEPGLGIAYSTSRPEHLLNVVAARMSILPAVPDHFVDWLRERGETTAGLADRFVPRFIYGEYLRKQLQQALADGLASRRSRVVELIAGSRHRLQLSDGSHVDAGAVVLAIGNSPRRLPIPHTGVAVIDAWDHLAVASIDPNSDVAIIGAGLSMVDAALTLAANGHRGRIDTYSRHGLVPLAHDLDHDIADIDVDAFAALPLRARLRHLRQWTADHPSRAWQAMIRTLRDPGQRLWQSMDNADQRRFLRHAVRYWDIHRHRIAPQVAATLAALQATGQLTMHAARPSALHIVDRGIGLTFVHRSAGSAQTHTFDRVINATGLETNLEISDNPLLQSLFRSGSACRGPHGQGLNSGADGTLLDHFGVPQANLFTLGSPRIGSLWESIAIPDIRVQAADLAALLLRPPAESRQRR